MSENPTFGTRANGFAEASAHPLEGGEQDAGAKLLYRLKEASHALGIGITNLYSLIDDGELETVWIGGRRLIPRKSLLAFIDRLPTEKPANVSAKKAA